ncbi:hypothetical protein GTP91_28425 [Rugamonas sp. FT82W]|uniref:PH domain-containing protein n=1 Tax=Duganella vulcania TaxID=2692166 RepID=A0A845GE23_9BURK|nr:hypothetical protein [Duganella vulcania]MYM91087.1 hypothetical protein [Duganella vulcania]
MAQTFHKQSIGFNPLLSARDWIVWGCLVAGFLAVALLASYWAPSALVRGALVGACIGQVPSLLMCLPVRGTVDAAGETAFVGRVRQFGFVPAGVTDEGRIFNYKTPRWMRWDSNRVVIRPADGVLHVTAPLYFYNRLKRMQA